MILAAWLERVIYILHTVDKQCIIKMNRRERQNNNKGKKEGEGQKKTLQ